MKPSNRITYILFLFLTVFIVSVSAEAQQTLKMVTVEKTDRFEVLRAASDSVLSTKIYPPPGSSLNSSLSEHPRSEEQQAVKEKVLQCFSSSRYDELKQNRDLLFMTIYTLQDGTISEILFQVRRNSNLNEKELMKIRSALLGMKITIPGAYVNYKYFKFFQTISFK